MPVKAGEEKIFRHLYLSAALIAVAFTLMVFASLVWNLHHEHLEHVGLARREALATFNKDLSLRAWATKHGGVYVPATAQTPPNPYLSHIPERDIVTPSGRRLTLMNPAYMLRQTMREYEELYGVKGHISSLNVLSPANAPDPWERSALLRFERGEKEVTEIMKQDGKSYFRLMEPLTAKEGCLKCHGGQGYKQGEIRGGVSVSIPMAPYLALEKKARRSQAVSHLFIWLLGMTGIGFAFSRGRAAIVERGKAEEVLASQGQLLEAVLDNSLICTAILDREFNFIRVNSAYARADEREVADFPGRNHFELYPSDLQPVFAEVVASGKPYGATARPFVYAGHPEREVSYWDWSLAPILDKKGEVEKLILTLDDVTARTRAQESIAERVMLAELSADIGVALAMPGELRSMLQQCTAALVRHLDVAFARIWTLDEKADLLELQASAGMYTHLDGAHSRIPVGSYKVGMIAGERKPHLTNAVIGDPLVHDQEWAVREGMVAFAGHPLLLGEKLVGVMAMFSRKPLTDVITRALDSVAGEIAIGIERKRTEKELLKLSAAIEQNPVAIVITDARGNIEFVNPKFFQVSGYAAEEVIGENPRILKSGETADEVYQALWQTITAGRIWHGELRNRRKNGELFWQYATIFPVLSNEGVITHFIAIEEDITERRNLENQLRQAQKMEAVGTLSGGIAHDFNNILTAIIGFASLLEMKMPKDDPLLHNVTQILAAADRATNLTRSLMAFSRKQQIETRVMNLGDIVTGLEKMLRRLIREDIDLTIDPAGEPLSVLVDGGQIEQVLINLVTNARDAMPDGGRLRITMGRATLDDEFKIVHGYGEPGEYALVVVADSGVGMADSVRSRIFDPFFTTKEVGKGTGLGLSVCYGIVKQHGGYINCYSEPGSGTTFRIYLPLAHEEVEPVEPLIAAHLTGGTETILLAEDDPVVRKLTTDILREFGYSVIEACDGEEAVAKFRADAAGISLCLFDVIMPKKRGWEALEAIRNIRPDARALFMSGYQADFDRLNDLTRDGAGFITKPVVPRDLLRKVRELLDG